MYRALGNEHQIFPISRGIPSGDVDTSPPINTGWPFVRPDVERVNGTVVCFPNNWLYVRYFFYQWYRDGVPIWGAIEALYRAKVEDINTALTCLVTGTNSLGSASRISQNSCYIAGYDDVEIDGLLLESSQYILLEDGTTRILVE